MSAPHRFAWVAEHADDPPPSEEEANARAERTPAEAWARLCEEADRMAAILAAGYKEETPFPVLAEDAPRVPRELMKYSGMASWAAAGVRGLLHEWVAEGRDPDDPQAAFLQGVLVGHAFTADVAMHALFVEGYRP